MSKVTKSLNKNIVLFIVFAILSVVTTVGMYYLSFKVFDKYIDNKIELAITKNEPDDESNVHDVITVNEVYTKDCVAYDVIVRSEQKYEDCRISSSEMLVIAANIRNYIANVKFNVNTFRQTCDYVKKLANEHNIKVYDVRLQESFTKNKSYYFYKYVEQ